MSKKENQSITYIYNEMDPSEKLEFERDLENDSNLLIEVESFKNISEKLFQLKCIHPPAEISDEILGRAETLRKKHSSSIGSRYMFAAAALIVIGLTSGVFLLNSSEGSTENNTGSAMIGSTESQLNNTFPVNVLSEQPAVVSSSGIVRSEVNAIEPWIDENDVIHFYDRFRADNIATIDSMFHHSYQKLTPVTDPSQSVSIQRHLHLTGSRR